MLNQPLIEDLLIKQLDQPLSGAEQAVVNEWLEASPENRELYNSYYDTEQLEKKLAEIRQFNEIASWEKLIASGRWSPDSKRKNVFRLFPKRWQYVAALLILAIGSGIYFWQGNMLNATNDKQEAANTETLPGGNKAILTIGNQTIVLSSDKQGVVNNGNSITYSDGSAVAGTATHLQPSTYNAISTPRGVQYHAELPDGSKVWLNAASSISFPARFSTIERRVKITGEVYFEVKHNSKVPFIVTSGNTNVQVLGTSFNINAYDNEKAVKTTLIEGSVRVSPIASNGRNVVLKPGQQAVAADNGDIIGVFNSDLASVLAWKNGFFSFENADIETVMRELERWYDIKVQYRGAVPTVKLNGELDRQIALTDVLRYLSRLNIKFEKEGRVITILP